MAGMIKFPDKYYVLDFETTSLSPEEGEIIETGLILVENGQIIKQIGELANPGFAIPAKIVEITGIQDSDLIGKRHPDIVIQDIFNELLSNNLYVLGQNILRFDLPWLNKYSQRLNLPKIQIERILDLLPCFKSYRAAHSKGHSNYSLPKSMKEFAHWAQPYLEYTYKTDKILTNLDVVVAYLGIPRFDVKDRHRAVADCVLTSRAFEILKEEFAK